MPNPFAPAISPVTAESTSSGQVTFFPVRKAVGGAPLPDQTIDAIAVEEPLEIGLAFGAATFSTRGPATASAFAPASSPNSAPRRETISVTMRTPGHDPELAAGFLFAEGIIPRVDAIATADAESPNRILVTLKDGILPAIEASQRRSVTNSGCGVCGLPSIESFRRLSGRSAATGAGEGPFIDIDLLYRLPAAGKDRQDVFNATGGLHAASLFDDSGRLLAIREDIGRHNAVDKIVGWAGFNRLLPLSSAILLLSGRACFELIQKAARAGIKIIAAIGPPSSLAIRMAEEWDITLVGFLREDRLNIYTGAWRLAKK
ncbi:MAG TPA: formate dehydrogenase accessory sulfurtransferase FdhD [Puia sp.]|nr:formate dehydrogenase accessory sulfurtransferase FdhD [Puia sp.]